MKFSAFMLGVLAFVTVLPMAPKAAVAQVSYEGTVGTLRTNLAYELGENLGDQTCFVKPPNLASATVLDGGSALAVLGTHHFAETSNAATAYAFATLSEPGAIAIFIETATSKSYVFVPHPEEPPKSVEPAGGDIGVWFILDDDVGTEETCIVCYDEYGEENFGLACSCSGICVEVCGTNPTCTGYNSCPGCPIVKPNRFDTVQEVCGYTDPYLDPRPLNELSPGETL